MLLFDPFAPFDSMLGRSWTPANAFLPAADISVSDGDIVLTMDLPGLTSDDLEIEVLNGFLTVCGERRRPELSEGATWTHSERSFGRFERRVKLPEGVDADAITANFENGVLSLIVPKPEQMKPRAITIGGSEQKQLAAA